MSDFVHIEPADNQRRAFARWALSQTPKLQTSSSTGTDVPLDLYPDVPPELLEGAFVDGFRYGGPEAPQRGGGAPPKAAAAPASAEDGNGRQTASSGPEHKPRKRTPRKPRKTAAQKLTAEQVSVPEQNTGSHDAASPDSANQ